MLNRTRFWPKKEVGISHFTPKMGQNLDTTVPQGQATVGPGVNRLLEGSISECDLVRMAYNNSSENIGYTAISYVGVLEDQLPTIYKEGLIFMQDSATINNAQNMTG